MKLELRKTFQFEAAHLLPHLPKQHKCRRLHGHSFKVDIVVSGVFRTWRPPASLPDAPPARMIGNGP